jgi:hypothetical protein
VAPVTKVESPAVPPLIAEATKCTAHTVPITSAICAAMVAMRWPV